MEDIIEDCIDQDDVIIASGEASKVIENNQNQETMGLFYQQLHAFSYIGNTLGQQESSIKNQHNESKLLSLLETYVNATKEDASNTANKPLVEKNTACHSPLNSSLHTYAKPVSNHLKEQLEEIVEAQPLNTVSQVGQHDAMFDIEFKQKSIGLKLGHDATKKYAIVKQCIENSEAYKYPNITPGIYIIAVNGK